MGKCSFIIGIILAVFIWALTGLPANAQTTAGADSQTQIQSLLAQIAALKEQVFKLQAQIAEQAKQIQILKRGSSGVEVKKIQQVLKSDQEIYPEGLVTGFFGPLTEKAIGRFQGKYNLLVTRQLDKPTNSKLKEVYGKIDTLVGMSNSKTSDVGARVSSVPSSVAPAPDNEEGLLANLNKEAREFFIRSRQIRAGYPEGHPYKYFRRDRDNDGLEDAMNENGYLHLKPQKNYYVPNPLLYKEIPTTIPETFYRYVRDCATKETIERQIITSTLGYKNYIGSDRYQQQCVDDGSADNYYVESLMMLKPPIMLNQPPGSNPSTGSQLTPSSAY